MAVEGLGKRIASEVDELTHEGIVEGTGVGAVFHFFGEDVAGIAFTSNVAGLGKVILNPFSDSIALEAHVIYVLHGDADGPIRASFIVVVKGGRS